MSKIADAYVKLIPTKILPFSQDTSGKKVTMGTVTVVPGATIEVYVTQNPETGVVELHPIYDRNNSDVVFNITTKDAASAEETVARITDYLDSIGVNSLEIK